MAFLSSSLMLDFIYSYNGGDFVKSEEWLKILTVFEGLILLLIHYNVNTFDDLYDKSIRIVKKHPYIFVDSLITPDFDEEFIPALHSLIVRRLIAFKGGKFALTTTGQKIIDNLLNSKLNELVSKFI